MVGSAPDEFFVQKLRVPGQVAEGCSSVGAGLFIWVLEEAGEDLDGGCQGRVKWVVVEAGVAQNYTGEFFDDFVVVGTEFYGLFQDLLVLLEFGVEVVGVSAHISEQI